MYMCVRHSVCVRACMRIGLYIIAPVEMHSPARLNSAQFISNVNATKLLLTSFRDKKLRIKNENLPLLLLIHLHHL